MDSEERVRSFVTVLWCCCCCLLIPSLLSPVEATGVPRIRNHAEQQMAHPGDTVLLPCLVEGDPPPMVEWYKDQVPVQPTWSRFRATQRGLRIKAVDPDDGGHYVCRAVNGFGTAQISLLLIITGDFPLQSDPDHEPDLPHNSREDEQVEEEEEGDEEEEEEDGEEEAGSETNLYPEEPSGSEFTGTKPVLRRLAAPGLVQRPRGSTVRLRCMAEGHPVPQLRWLKNDRELPPDVGKRMRRGRWTLTLHNLQPEDSGMYTCLAANRVGAANASFPVEVVDRLRNKPTMSGVHPINTTVEVGGTASFQCRVHSQATPLIQWLKREPNGPVKVRGERFRVLQSSQVVSSQDNGDAIYLNKLVVGPAAHKDSGMYVCLGTNAMGYNYRSAFLTVVSTPNWRPVTESTNRFPISLTVVVPVALALIFVGLSVVFLRRRRKRTCPPPPPGHHQQQQHRTGSARTEERPLAASAGYDGARTTDRLWAPPPPGSSCCSAPLPPPQPLMLAPLRPASQGSDGSRSSSCGGGANARYLLHPHLLHGPQQQQQQQYPLLYSC